MKRVYFVRHGETNANIHSYFQGPDEPLNDTGRRQAVQLAERLQNLDFEKMIVSDYVRARQTAEPILEVKNVPVEYVPVFREERRPSSWIGVKQEQSAEGQAFYANLIEKADDPDWRIEDMENPHDVFKRIQSAVMLLEEETAQSILVVSHGDFIRQLIGYLLLDTKGTVGEVARLRKVLKTTNTGISMIYHDDTRWRVLTWNDIAHFAE